MPVALAEGTELDIAEPGEGSEHRVNDMVHNHVLYAYWQSAHVTRGEYRSRPQAMLRRVVVKFAIYCRRGPTSDEGMFVES